MPVHNLCFGASCGQFLTTFLGFMTEQASCAAKVRKQVITVRNRLDALLLVFVVRHLLCYDDVEMNPGPRKIIWHNTLSQAIFMTTHPMDQIK